MFKLCLLYKNLLKRLGEEGAWCLEEELTCVEVSSFGFYRFFYHFENYFIQLFQMKVVFLFQNYTKHWGIKKKGLATTEDKLGGPPKQCHDVSHGTFEII